MRLLLAIGVITVSLPLFLCPVHFAVDAEFWERLMDAAHLPFFAAMMLVFSRLMAGGKALRPKLIALAGIAAAAMAGLIEWLQPHFGRTESFADFRNGVFGVVIVTGALVLLSHHKPSWLWLLWGAATAALISLAAQPAWQEGRSIVWRRNHLPLIGDFETEAELPLWQPQGGSEKSVTAVHPDTTRAAHGKRSLRVETGAGSWAGVSYSAGSKDWSGHRVLAWEVFNPGADFTLGLRIDDDGDCSHYGQRYDNGFSVKPGWNHFQVSLGEIEHGPRTRMLSLKAVRRVALFTGDREPQRRFYLDYVRLE